MAHYLQGLIAAALAGPVPAAPFSHAVHLQLKLSCVACHAAALTSASADDNLLPSERVCSGCHPHVAVRRAPTRTMAAKFNHQLHLKLGNIAPVIAAAIDRGAYLSPPGDLRRALNTNNACEACHRGMERAGAISLENFPKMADCLVCHNQIEPPFSCEKCHAPEQTLKPASHAPGFFDEHSSGKLKLDKASCAVCHGRTFHCQGCH